MQEIRAFHVWIEGYSATGDRARAQYLGLIEAESFEDAVRTYYQENPSESFNPTTLDFWGCRHFDNEADARRQFG